MDSQLNIDRIALLIGRLTLNAEVLAQQIEELKKKIEEKKNGE